MGFALQSAAVSGSQAELAELAELAGLAALGFGRGVREQSMEGQVGS